MQNPRFWQRPLLLLHLFVCFVWLYALRSQDSADWVGHVLILSILAIQFTWGFTVGLIVGPSRKRRPLLWWSLLTVFMPLWIYGGVVHVFFWMFGPLLALLYLAAIIAIVASETYCGVLLGAKAHSEAWED